MNYIANKERYVVHFIRFFCLLISMWFAVGRMRGANNWVYLSGSID